MNPLAQWNELVKKRSMAGLANILADDAVFLSPVAFTPKPGKQTVIQFLTAAMALLGNDSFHYVREIIGPNDAALKFEVVLDAMQMKKWGQTRFSCLARATRNSIISVYCRYHCIPLTSLRSRT